MTYLEVKQLRVIDPVAFRSQQPYPWINRDDLDVAKPWKEFIEETRRLTRAD